MLNKNRIRLVSITFLAVVVLAIAAWRFYESSPLQIFSFGASDAGVVNNKSAPSITTSVPISQDAIKMAAATSNVSPQLASSGADLSVSRKIPVGVIGENLRKLLNSNELTKIDYGISRMRPWCMVSFKRASERETVLARMADSIKRDRQSALAGAARSLEAGGNASLEPRVAAMDRFYELCKISTEDNPVIGDEYERIKLKPEFERRQAIASIFLNPNIDFNDARVRNALETVVRSPMYATLGDILRNNLDISSLASKYAENQMFTLSLFASEILVCRLGDDCGPDGFANLRFCESIGICGNDLESGIWDYLKENKVDTTAFRQFIDQRQQALNLLDFSILKKPK